MSELDEKMNNDNNQFSTLHADGAELRTSDANSNSDGNSNNSSSSNDQIPNLRAKAINSLYGKVNAETIEKQEDSYNKERRIVQALSQEFKGKPDINNLKIKDNIYTWAFTKWGQYHQDDSLIKTALSELLNDKKLNAADYVTKRGEDKLITPDYKVLAVLDPENYCPFYEADTWLKYAFEACEFEADYDPKCKKDNNTKVAEEMKKNKVSYNEMLSVAWDYDDNNLFKNIDKYKQVVFTGAPGTGKTFGIRSYIKNRCVDPVGGKLSYKVVEGAAKTINQFEFVQFHSSYDYSDFMEGLRPITQPGNEQPVFVRMDGAFMKFCRQVAEYNKTDNSSPVEFYFIIDEINRADLGKVFGELMFGLEEGYRNEKFRTQYSNLPTYYYDVENKKWLKYARSHEEMDVPNGIGEKDVFEEGFFIPDNIHIIGSMNDIDRSVETFDFALRRRFKWFRVDAPKNKDDFVNKMRVILHSKVIDYICSGKEDQYLELYTRVSNALGILADRVLKLNKKISEALSDDYCIGPAYFKNYDFCKPPFKQRQEFWNNSIMPILLEYVRGRSADRQKDFINECQKAYGLYDFSKEEIEKYLDDRLADSGKTDLIKKLPIKIINYNKAIQNNNYSEEKGYPSTESLRINTDRIDSMIEKAKDDDSLDLDSFIGSWEAVFGDEFDDDNKKGTIKKVWEDSAVESQTKNRTSKSADIPHGEG